MYVRVVQASVKPKRLLEFKHAVKNHDRPAIERLPGFVDEVELYSKNHFLSITFWETEATAEHYARTVFPRMAARSEPLVHDTTLRALPYEAAYDTTHEAAKETEAVIARTLAAAA